MNTLASPVLAPTRTSGHSAHPWRAVLRSTAVLVLALGLTTVVLVALANAMEGWA